VQIAQEHKNTIRWNIPRKKRQQITVVPLDSLVKLIFPIVELLTDSPSRESPEGGVATNLMFIRNELDGLKRLLRVMLMVMDVVFIMAHDLWLFKRLGCHCDFFLNNSAFFTLFRDEITAFQGERLTGRHRGNAIGRFILLMDGLRLRLVGFDEPWTLITL
jgi:hypothetical protein